MCGDPPPCSSPEVAASGPHTADASQQHAALSGGAGGAFSAAADWLKCQLCFFFLQVLRDLVLPPHHMTSGDQLASLVVNQRCEAGLVLSGGTARRKSLLCPDLKHNASLFSRVDLKEVVSQLGGCSVVIREATHQH